MTIVELLLSLRPADGSVASTLAAIGRARIAMADADEAVVAAQQEHNASLLDADPARFPDALKRLGRTKLETAEIREKVSALLRQLEERLPVAKQNEASARAVAAKEEAEATSLEFEKAWESKRAALAAELRALELLDSARSTARLVFESVAASVGRDFPNLHIPRPKSSNGSYRWREEVSSMSVPVRKPRVPVPDPEGDVLRQEREEMIRVRDASYIPHDRRPGHDASPAWPN